MGKNKPELVAAIRVKVRKVFRLPSLTLFQLQLARELVCYCKTTKKVLKNEIKKAALSERLGGVLL